MGGLASAVYHPRGDVTEFVTEGLRQLVRVVKNFGGQFHTHIVAVMSVICARRPLEHLVFRV